MISSGKNLTCVALGLAAAISAAALVAPMNAQSATACDTFLPAQREARGQKVGPSSCLVLESTVPIAGRKFQRFDIGLDGTVEGVGHENRRL